MVLAQMSLGGNGQASPVQGWVLDNRPADGPTIRAEAGGERAATRSCCWCLTTMNTSKLAFFPK